MHDGAGADSDIQGDREVQIAGTMNLDKCSTTAMEPLRNKIEGSVDDRVQYRVLYLFSGPRRPGDGFEQACMELGMKCTCVDVEYNPKQDLLCQDYWESLQNEMDQYDAYLMSPPCCTFSIARSGKGDGPGPLRGTTGTDRYGLKHLTAEEKTKVREGTLLSRRAHSTASRAQLHEKPWILEQPHWRPGGTSMFMLDEFVQLAGQDDVNFHTFDQCEYSCEFQKTTDLLSNIQADIMAPFSKRCSHEKKWWTIPWSGKTSYSSHPPLKGRQKAVLSDEWDASMLRDKEPWGDFLTRSTAAYPAMMNQQLAKCIRAACDRTATAKRNRQQQAAECSDHLRVGALDPKITQAEPLKGECVRPEVSDMNSLRNIHKSINSRMLFIGKQVQNLIESALDEHGELQDELVGCLGERTEFSDDVNNMVDSLRLQVCELLVRNRRPDMNSHCSVDQVCNEDYQTVVRGELMWYWSQCVGDPATNVARWLIDGAPAGITQDTSALDGVCPRVDDDTEEGFFDLTTDYSGVEENDEAFQTLQSYADKGYLRVFDKLEDLESHVGAKPTLSKIGCIVKQKTNYATGLVTKKTRIILDCKRSHVSKVATRTHKSVLPRVSDAIQSTLSMQSDCRDGDGVALLVADVIDAFWLVPLHKSERRYFCAKLRNKFFCFHRTAQGSRAAPLTFAAIIALASRWVQSTVATPRHMGMHTEEARVQTYVDDPLVTIRGTPERQRRLTATVLIAWMIMGFPIAVHKATLSTKLTWIGVELSVLAEGVEAVVPQDKVLELNEILQTMLQSNVVPKRTLRTVIGKAMSIASVLFCWRPFIQELYMALYVKDSCAPKECIWTKQVRHTILWLLTFLRDEMAGIRRIYTVRSFQHQLPLVTITWDASPFGMGATLQLGDVFVEYFAIQIDSLDEETLQVKAGIHEGQQTWEALAGLVSLRHWRSSWYGQRARLQVRSDNTGALSMLSKLKGGSKALTLIAREFALDLGQAQWKPDVITHVPGLANKNCDVLSRKWDPSKKFELPDALRMAREVSPVQRTRSWWKTLAFEDEFLAPGRPNAAKWGCERKR